MTPQEKLVAALTEIAREATAETNKANAARIAAMDTRSAAERALKKAERDLLDRGSEQESKRHAEEQAWLRVAQERSKVTP